MQGSCAIVCQRLRLAEQAGTASMAYYTDLFIAETWEAFRAQYAIVRGAIALGCKHDDRL
jgi:hypothetical protein